MQAEACKTEQILEYLFTPYISFNIVSDNKTKKEHNKNSTQKYNPKFKFLHPPYWKGNKNHSGHKSTDSITTATQGLFLQN